jgi:pilus assembly protein CpaD
MPQSPARARLGPVLAVLAGVTLLATCTEPVYQDYTQRFPIGTQPETVNLPAHFVSSADPFAGAAAAESFDTLVEAYLDRGHGPITIAARAPDARGSRLAPARMEQLRQRLIAAGVPASAIRLQLASEGEPDTVTLSYERYTALVPTCGDWSARMDFNPLNIDYAGFGCAQQHNLGVMIADPADLVSMRRAQPSDTANVERVIRQYRGVPAAAPVATESQKNGLQGSADLNAASGSSVGAGAGGSGGSSTR